MKNSIKLIVFLFFIINYSKVILAEEKVVFSINENSFTTIDIEKRIIYHMFINKIKISNSGKVELYQLGKKFIIEEKLLEEFIKELKIEISSQDINTTYNNVINFVANGDKSYFNDKKNEYLITEKEIKEYVRDEIINNIVNLYLSKKINIKEIDELIIDDFIEYKINNLILYRNELDNEEYNKEKNNIINIFKNNTFNKSIELIKEKKFNINFNINKWVNLNKISSEIKNLVLKSNFNKKIFYENDQGLFILEKLDKRFPDINIDYSFLQLISDNKENFNKYLNIDNLCDKKIYENIKNDQIKIKFFDKINYKDLNKEIFNKLDKKNNKLIMSNNDHYLIILCKFNYDKNELKNYVINNKYMDKIILLRRNLIDDLKIKHNFIEYN